MGKGQVETLAVCVIDCDRLGLKSVMTIVRQTTEAAEDMFDTPLTNINDQSVLGMFGEKESKKIVDTIEQINRNAVVA